MKTEIVEHHSKDKTKLKETVLKMTENKKQTEKITPVEGLSKKETNTRKVSVLEFYIFIYGAPGNIKHVARTLVL